MRRTFVALASLWIATSLAIAGGCASSHGSGDTGSSSTASSSNLSSDSTGAVTLLDLMPTFQNDCSTANGGTCHGGSDVTTQSQPRPYFGPYLMPLDAGTQLPDGAPVVDTVYKGLVNVPSNEAPSMVYVKPSDPGSSFLWHKIDGPNGDLASIASLCTGDLSDAGAGNTCGVRMPNTTVNGMTEPALDQATLNKIQSWIQSGAPEFPN